MRRTYKEEYQHWLDSPALNESEWEELNSIADDEKEIESRFFEPLSFGTAGLRGTMKLGLHHMNIHVIRHVTQSFANVINNEGVETALKGIVICYDCRQNSQEFAREAACVMAANGIKVRLFPSLHPTPELSFAIRYYGAAAGINVTASHNPKEYNGYKVYWSDGAQLPPQKAEQIAEQMEEIDLFNDFSTCDYDEAVEKGQILLLDEETDEAFLKRVLGQAIDREAVEAVADRFKVVYTPFHGCGYKLIPEALRRLGIRNLYPVAEQMVIDGTFPTVESPNPENPEGFALAVELARKVGSDLIIGSDPDADRVGVLVRKGEDYIPITGNQMGVLLLDYIIKARYRTETMPDHPGAVKSIVTTEMAKEVCRRNNVHMEDTFTGFKFMAERIAQWEQEGSYQYIFAYEESYGYMMGDYVRDKDAVTASVLIAEMAAYYFGRGMTLADAIQEKYEEYGYFEEKTLNLVMPGLDGLERMAKLMDDLRREPFSEIAGTGVEQLRDYLDGSVSVAHLGKVGTTSIRGSNVLYYDLADNTSFIVRPSGTEPKIKIYILADGSSREEVQEKIARYQEFAEKLAQ